ncbi:26S proteasome regulatory subunit 6A homolog [Camellia sinensis]|uniref:26S proteasome regulatory subunit 6A homolog n=1 Tax=Camellia sinensis TaxID=4442 RepID=UPI001036EA4F|nr:26S proteasome regulatory subunit 6A homolog [Camellia sinensis]
MTGLIKLMSTTKFTNGQLKFLKRTPFWMMFDILINTKIELLSYMKYDDVIAKIIETYNLASNSFEIGPKFLKLSTHDIKLIFGVDCESMPMETSYGSKPTFGLIEFVIHVTLIMLSHIIDIPTLTFVFQYWLCVRTKIVEPILENAASRFLKWNLTKLHKNVKILSLSSINDNEVYKEKLIPTDHESTLFLHTIIRDGENQKDAPQSIIHHEVKIEKEMDMSIQEDDIDETYNVELGNQLQFQTNVDHYVNIVEEMGMSSNIPEDDIDVTYDREFGNEAQFQSNAHDKANIEEGAETIAYLHLLQRNDPEKFVNPGIDPPKGVLCYGPPGTGKTLLARAVANRTDACFIRVIGSELVKKYVGEGARLVRELFQMARSKKACIVFFDELDAIGSARFDDGVGGDNEVQGTMLEIVNQLDGFDARGNIKVLMATNRPDTLNPSVTSGSVVGAI